MTFLGIDLGTSALKAVLVDERQAVVAEASAQIPTLAPRPGWSEQEPRAWRAALDETVGALRAAAPKAFANVRALGLSGQMHGAVLLDREGAPIRPVIIWNDSRATAECAALEAAVPDLPKIAGIKAMPGFTAPKLLWLKAHEPQNFARIAKIALPKDLLRLWLTGEVVTDLSDAAGTLWLDQAKRDWSDALLSASGLSRDTMPALKEGSEPSGYLRDQILREWGIAGPVVVAAGAGDVAAAATGIGAVEDGDAFVSLGTSAQFLVADDRYRPKPEALLHAFAHALPGRWFRMAAMLNGASCLDVVARAIGGGHIDKLLDVAEAHYGAPSRVLFLPYLSGERTPHDDPHARGVFAGLDLDVGASDLMQATLEGVAFSLLEAKHLMEDAGVHLTQIAAVGGGARSAFFVQMIANVLGLPVVRYAGSGVGPAFGAARLARLALTGESASEICMKPPVLDASMPDQALTAAYARRFEAYARLYRALREEFRQISQTTIGAETVR
jgi:xylulokinase